MRISSILGNNSYKEGRKEAEKWDLKLRIRFPLRKRKRKRNHEVPINWTFSNMSSKESSWMKLITSRVRIQTNAKGHSNLALPTVGVSPEHQCKISMMIFLVSFLSSKSRPSGNSNIYQYIVLKFLVEPIYKQGRKWRWLTVNAGTNSAAHSS
jgi:hypothetical protein